MHALCPPELRFLCGGWSGSANAVHAWCMFPPLLLGLEGNGGGGGVGRRLLGHRLKGGGLSLAFAECWSGPLFPSCCAASLTHTLVVTGEGQARVAGR